MEKIRKTRGKNLYSNATTVESTQPGEVTPAVFCHD
jgi:hypothetical protein